MSVIEKLAARNHLSEEQVARIGRRVARMVKEAREDPQLMEEVIEKLALNPFFEKSLKMFGQGAVLGGGIAGGAKAVHMISDRIQDHRKAIEKARSFKSMIDANPDLQGADVDSRMVQRHYDTLHKFNPEYASDPMVAGAYVSNSLWNARPNIETLNNVVKARASYMQAAKATPRPGEQLLKPIGGLAEKLMSHRKDSSE